MADMKLRIRLEKSETYYYSDIMVSCATADRAPFFREKPILIAEILVVGPLARGRDADSGSIEIVMSSHRD
jgi:hypothetical protein